MKQKNTLWLIDRYQKRFFKLLNTEKSKQISWNMSTGGRLYWKSISSEGNEKLFKSVIKQKK